MVCFSFQTNWKAEESALEKHDQHRQCKIVHEEVKAWITIVLYWLKIDIYLYLNGICKSQLCEGQIKYS